MPELKKAAIDANFLAIRRACRLPGCLCVRAAASPVE